VRRVVADAQHFAGGFLLWEIQLFGAAVGFRLPRSRDRIPEKVTGLGRSRWSEAKPLRNDKVHRSFREALQLLGPLDAALKRPARLPDARSCREDKARNDRI
jgi:hypothetical protein